MQEFLYPGCFSIEIKADRRLLQKRTNLFIDNTPINDMYPNRNEMKGGVIYTLALLLLMILIEHKKASAGVIGCNNEFDSVKELIDSYIDSAEIFIQISTVLLGITVTFRDRISQNRFMLRHPLFLSWICLFFSIFCASLYCYFAVKYLEVKYKIGEQILTYPYPLSELYNYPGIFYVAMVILFILGCVFLVWSATSFWHCTQTNSD